MALGEVDRGAGKLREALELAVANGCLPEVRAAYINLADLLHQRGRSDEARAVAHEGAERASRHRREQRVGQHRRGRDRAGHRRLGRTPSATCPIPGPSPAPRFVNFALRHAELALGRGDREARERCSTTSTPPRSTSTSRSSSASSGALRAELERRAGDLDAARAAIRRALDRIETCTDDVVRLARVAAVGVVVEADAAQRACDLGDDEERRRALMEAEFHLGRVGRRRRGRRPGRGRVAAQRRGRARPRRRQGRSRAARGRGARRGRRSSAPTPPRSCAGARARRTSPPGERDAATAALERAHEIAAALGAGWLRGEIEGLAARARLVLAGADGARRRARRDAVAQEDPFGLTPRERQVLVLVAEGRTNREIGDSLFMAEKTASVHVSRILAKLDVRSRTEAAAVAHRLGLDGDVGRRPTCLTPLS